MYKLHMNGEVIATGRAQTRTKFTTVLGTTKITKKRSDSLSLNKEFPKKNAGITEKQLKRFYNSPQPVAALLLGVSLSSLKRRYYEIIRTKSGSDQQAKRWPYQSLSMMDRKRSLYYVLNGKEENCCVLDAETIDALDKAFKSVPVQKQ